MKTFDGHFPEKWLSKGRVSNILFETEKNEVIVQAKENLFAKFTFMFKHSENRRSDGNSCTWYLKVLSSIHT